MANKTVGAAIAVIGACLMLGASPTPSVCDFHVSPVWLEFDGTARSGAIDIQTGPGCAWTADVTASWIAISASTGTGPSTLAYSVAPFVSSESSSDTIRQGAIRVRWNTPTAGQNVWITQTIAPCRMYLLSTGETFGPLASSGSLYTFTVDRADPWRIVAASDWIHLIRPPMGLLWQGSQEIVFTVDPNPELSPRDGFVQSCNGPPIRIHQAGRSRRGGPYVPADVDDDGVADLVVYRRTTGTWHAQRSTTQFTQPIVFSDGVPYPANYPVVPVPVDFDGDARMELTAYSGSWQIRYSSDSYLSKGFSTFPALEPYFGPFDPLLADFNGDGRSDYVAFYQSTGEWFVRASDSLAPLRVAERSQWGRPGDIAVPADFDGDGISDLAVWRPSNGTWYLRLSSTGYDPLRPGVIQWGLPGDVPIPGDFDGDGHADLAVWRPSDGTWYVVFAKASYASSSSARLQWGLPEDVPVANDYDGDGRLDYAVWRPSTGVWYLLLSTRQYSYAGAKAIQWGLPGDIPVAPRIASPSR